MSYRVLVTGDRHWDCTTVATTAICRLSAEHGDLVIVAGGATGVDSAFARVAHLARVRVECVPADWATFGRRAGPLRNQAMVDRGADVCLACHRDLASSRGTKDCVRRALKAGIPVYLIDDDDARPRRILDADAPDQPALFGEDEEAPR
jgi:hypothetical protein